MRRSKKLIIVAVLAALILIGSIGGIALANNGDDSQPGTPFAGLLDRVCAIYKNNTGNDIDPEALANAFDQAQKEIRTEAMKNRLQSLVEQGQITQEQADQYLEWQQSRPDVPFGSDAPFGFGFHGHGGPRGFGGSCLPRNGQ